MVIECTLFLTMLQVKLILLKNDFSFSFFFSNIFQKNIQAPNVSSTIAQKSKGPTPWEANHQQKPTALANGSQAQQLSAANIVSGSCNQWFFAVSHKLLLFPFFLIQIWIYMLCINTKCSKNTVQIFILKKKSKIE